MTAFWSKFKKDTDEKKPQEEKKADDSKVVVSEEPKKVSAEPKKADKKDKKAKKEKLANFGEKAELVNRVIIRPVVSEDAMTKEALGKYVFEVATNASKNEIGKAIEARFGVKVTKVNVVNYKQKMHQFRLVRGKKKAIKKAIVTIKKGDKIELFTEK